MNDRHEPDADADTKAQTAEHATRQSVREAIGKLIGDDSARSGAERPDDADPPPRP